MEPVRVGLIGANSEKGWAARTHLPALDGLDEFMLQAVATTRMVTARATAARYGVPRAYDDAYALIADPSIQLVVVAVRVTDHVKLVRAAFEAGKHVLCEWPLAFTTREAHDLLTIADEHSRRHFISLQAAVAPQVRYAAQLLARGHIGATELATIRIAAIPGGASFSVDAPGYLLDATSGASVMGIQLAHTLIGVETMLGQLTTVAAIRRNQHTRIEIVETGEVLDSEIPDHVALVAEAGSGVLITANAGVGIPENPGTVIDVVGSAGTLRLEAVAALQYSDLELLISQTGAEDGNAMKRIQIPTSFRQASASLDGPAAGNIAELYSAIGRDLQTGSHEAPDFETAVHMHQVLDAIGSTREFKVG